MGVLNLPFLLQSAPSRRSRPSWASTLADACVAGYPWADFISYHTRRRKPLVGRSIPNAVRYRLSTGCGFGWDKWRRGLADFSTSPHTQSHLEVRTSDTRGIGDQK